MPMNYFDISPQTAGYLPLLTELRRHLHRHPEESGCEFATRDWLLETLRPLKPDALCVLAETGVKAVFLPKGEAKAKKGDALAWRADIDALNIAECTGAAYASQTPGMMHACGHDGHTALALAAAHHVAKLHDEGGLSRAVVFLFQPAEETIGGADRMVGEGALNDPGVTEMYGLHLMPDLPIGSVALRSGPLMASTRELDITLKGKLAHGALPHKGADAVAAAAHFIQTLPAVLARRIDPTQPRLVTFGRLEAGTQRNVIAQSARMEAIVRTFSHDVDRAVYELTCACADTLKPLFGVDYEISEHAYYPPVVNPQALYEKALAIVGDAAVEATPALTAEDFSFFQRHVPAMFMFLGCRDDAHSSPLHTATFDFDERALLYGLEFFFRLLA